MTDLPQPLTPADCAKPKRAGISKKTRFEVFKRDGFCCQYCGAVPPAAVLEVDHIDPVCEGGKNNADNLITSCFNCNRGKAGNLLTVIPQSLAAKAAEIKEREEQIAGYRAIIQQRLDRIDADMWRVADALIENASIDGMRRDWLQSIKNFNTRMDVFDVIDAAEIARSAKTYTIESRFRYFCGVCWNRIKESQ